jgi:hypothetical protein
MPSLTLLVTVVCGALVTPSFATTIHADAAADEADTTLFQFHNMVRIDGSSMDLAELKGNVTMIINVASL